MNKKITLFDAVSIGVGGMVGGGIFAVLGEAILLGHSATPIAFFIAGLIAIFTSYSYAKLSVKFPSEGGTVTFLYKGLGENILSKSLNLILWLSYIVTISLYALAFGSYSATFFPSNFDQNILKHLLLSFAIILVTVLNLFDAKIIARFEFYIVGIKIGILLLILYFGFSYIDMNNFSNIKDQGGFSIIVAGMIIFVAYEGFELIANSAKDIINPEKNLPRAYFISTIGVTILYILIAILTVGTLSESVIVATSDYALAEAAKPALGNLGFQLVGIAAILATLSAINATIYGNARLGYSLAIDRELPQYFSRKMLNDSYFGVIILGFLSLLMANLIDLTSIATIASIGFLLIFSFVNLAALKLYKEIFANRLVLIFSTCITFFSLFILLYKTYNSNFTAILIFIIFILFAIIFESTYGVTRDEQIFRLKRLKSHFKNTIKKIIK